MLTTTSSASTWRAGSLDSHREGKSKGKLLHGIYHEKFKGMKVREAWLVRARDGFYLKVVFSKTVETVEPNGRVIAVDVNENNVAFGSPEAVMAHQAVAPPSVPMKLASEIQGWLIANASRPLRCKPRFLKNR